MKECFSCKQNVVDPSDVARYDVLNPDYDKDSDPMSGFGPYCAECFETTETGKIIAENNQPKEL